MRNILKPWVLKNHRGIIEYACRELFDNGDIRFVRGTIFQTLSYDWSSVQTFDARYQSLEEAINAVDTLLIKQGYILLTEEQYDKFKSLL
jgi:hypothetical protein